MRLVDKIMEMMYKISIASFISLLILLIIWYFSTLPTLKSSINALNSQTLSFLIFGSFLLILDLQYGRKISKDNITKLEEFYAKKFPFIIMGIGYSLILVSFLVTINIPPKSPATSTVYGLIIMGLMGFGLFIFIPSGIILLIVSLSAKKYLEDEVSFTLKQAIEILEQAKNKNQLDTKNLKRYIYLTYRNIERKFRTLDLEYTFLNLLPDYIEVAGEEQLKSLKNNLENMFNSVKQGNEKDEINWNVLTNVLLKLNDDIIRYLRETNFNVTERKISRQSQWMLRNKEAIFQVIQLIVLILTSILAYYQKP
ncbi:MAG: hypothetical protein FIB08_17730 [Candidatus Methanoperedens sp.]|nr:hypothetical protein [Candidatus Methanoperedens sp.]